MEGLELLLNGLVEKLPWLMLILSILGSLVVVGQAVVIITPSKKDDEFVEGLEKNGILGGILKLLKKFAVIQKK
mgnify:CR=1 FL=1